MALHSNKIDREVYWEATGAISASNSNGGWTTTLKGVKPRTKWFKKQFCGHVLRPSILSFSNN